MRIFRIDAGGITEQDSLPTAPADQGFFWIACARGELQLQLADVQEALQNVTGNQLVDLHVSDLLNHQLPSRYDYTSQYDLLFFRRLATAAATPEDGEPGKRRTGPPVLRRIDTAVVGCAVFDNLLLTVHPQDCAVGDVFAARLQLTAGDSAHGALARWPAGPADLMLRLVNQMVDAYLELRRDLSRQLDHWQAELLSPRTRFNNWAALLDARLSLHALDEVCEDQRIAVLDWIAAVETWPTADTATAQREHDLLKVRGRDVLEHIERVVRHIRRLEQNTETTVQMHFNAQSNRTSEIMRTLTALTAVFLPLNLITGFFGMNFEYLPLIHREAGLWWAVGIMAVVAIVFFVVLRRKRYLARSAR